MVERHVPKESMERLSELHEQRIAYWLSEGLARLRAEALASFDVYGGDTWTDGRPDAVGLPEAQAIWDERKSNGFGRRAPTDAEVDAYLVEMPHFTRELADFVLAVGPCLWSTDDQGRAWPMYRNIDCVADAMSRAGASFEGRPITVEPEPPDATSPNG